MTYRDGLKIGELVERRRQHSKTFYLGKTPDGRHKYACNSSLGSLHYRDQTGGWQDIDTAISSDGTIDKAPYKLQVSQTGLPGFIITDKKEHKFDVKLSAGRVGPVEITPVLNRKPTIIANRMTWSDVWPGVDVTLIARNDKVHLIRTIKSKSSCHKFDVDIIESGSGKLMVLPLRPATDAQGAKLAMEVKDRIGGRTETVKVDTKTVYPVIDAVDISVVASADDCYVYWDGSAWTIGIASPYQWVGYGGALSYKKGGGMRFLNVNIPKVATITAATFTVVCAYATTPTDVNSVIIGELSVVPATFSTLADYQARRGTIVGGADDTQITTAYVNWNTIPAWVLGTSYTSPDFSAVVQEWHDLPAYVGDGTDDLVIFWDDHADLSDHGSAERIKVGASWDNVTYVPPAIYIEYTTSSFGIDPLTETEAVYYEAYDGTTLDGRTDVTAQSAEERAITLAAFKAAFPGDTYYQHGHHHGGLLASCTQVVV